MRTLAVGSKRPGDPARGFTLLELLVVVALIAVATAGVSLSLRDSADSALERDAERLVSLLEAARAQARANGSPVVWRAMVHADPLPNGTSDLVAPDFVFEGLPPQGLPRHWLNKTTRVTGDNALVLGPEPLIGPQMLALSGPDRPGQVPRQLWVVTDGLRPFRVQSRSEHNTPQDIAQQVPPGQVRP